MRIAIVLAGALWLGAAAHGQETRNVVLVTVDGLRHQELFGGADAAILESGDQAGIENVASLREAFWRDSETARREALMPFFWRELVPSGLLMRSSIANPHRNSFPGYAEILTGAVVSEITGNVDRQIPHETLLDIARRGLGLDATEVAVFTSWEHFDWIVERERGTLFVNAGYERVPAAVSSPSMDRWGELQFDMRTPWDSVRHNAVTMGLALAYLEAHRPRVLYVALDETDEWAHARRYDRTLQAIHSFDDGLRELWTTLQSMDPYRGRTSLVITTDHGRGRTPDDWTSHGSDVESCEETWIAILGPDTPARGVIAERATNAQVAATVLALLGLDPEALGPAAGAPIPAALR